VYQQCDEYTQLQAANEYLFDGSGSKNCRNILKRPIIDPYYNIRFKGLRIIFRIIKYYKKRLHNQNITKIESQVAISSTTVLITVCRLQ